MCKKNLNSTLNVRLNEDDIRGFKQVCKKLGRPYQEMLRELVTAFSESRVRIIPTDEQQKSLNKVYG